MDSASKTSTKLHKASKGGASKRKPAITRHVVDDSLAEISSGKDEASPVEDEEMEDLEPKTKENGEVKNVKVKGEAEDDNSITFEDEELMYDEDGKIILPEGTVVVQPEAVKDKDEDFHGPEFGYCLRNKFKGSVDDQIITCTACGQQVNHKMTAFVKKHPVLEVLLCRKCFNFYNSGTFSQDENGLDEFCRWCAEGGKLICCDSCHNAFCKECIRRNFGRKTLSEIMNSDNWSCFVCDPLPLQELRDFCDIVLKNSKKTVLTSKKLALLDTSKKDGGGANSEDETVGETDLGQTLNKTLLALNMLRSRIQDLKSKVKINSSNPSELLRITKKFTKDVTVTKKNMKVIQNDLVKNAKRYRSQKRQIVNDIENKDSSRPVNGCVNDPKIKMPKRSDHKIKLTEHSDVKSSTERKPRHRSKPEPSSSANRRSFASRRSQFSRHKGIVSRKVKQCDLSSDTEPDSDEASNSNLKKASEDTKAHSTTSRNGDSKDQIPSDDQGDGVANTSGAEDDSLPLKGESGMDKDDDVMDVSEDRQDHYSTTESGTLTKKNSIMDDAEELDVLEDKGSTSSSPSQRKLLRNKQKECLEGSDQETNNASCNSSGLENEVGKKVAKATKHKLSLRRHSAKANTVDESIDGGGNSRDSTTVADGETGKSDKKSAKPKQKKDSNVPVKNAEKVIETNEETGMASESVAGDLDCETHSDKLTAEDTLEASKELTKSKEIENEPNQTESENPRSKSRNVKKLPRNGKEETPETDNDGDVESEDKNDTAIRKGAKVKAGKSNGDNSEVENVKSKSDAGSTALSSEKTKNSPQMSEEDEMETVTASDVEHELMNIDQDAYESEESSTESARRKTGANKTLPTKEEVNVPEKIGSGSESDEADKNDSVHRPRRQKIRVEKGLHSKGGDKPANETKESEELSKVASPPKSLKMQKLSNKESKVKDNHENETIQANDIISAIDSEETVKEIFSLTKKPSKQLSKKTQNLEGENNTNDDENMPSDNSESTIEAAGTSKGIPLRKSSRRARVADNGENKASLNISGDEEANTDNDEVSNEASIRKSRTGKKSPNKTASGKEDEANFETDENDVIANSGSNCEPENAVEDALSPKSQKTKSPSKKTKNMKDEAVAENNKDIGKELPSDDGDVTSEDVETPKENSKRRSSRKASSSNRKSNDSEDISAKGEGEEKKKAVVRKKPSENVSEDPESENEARKQKVKNTKKQAKGSENSADETINPDSDNFKDDQDDDKSNSASEEKGSVDQAADKSIVETGKLTANEEAKKKLLEEMDDSSDSEPSTPTNNSQHSGPRQKVTPRKTSEDSPPHSTDSQRKSAKPEKSPNRDSSVDSESSDFFSSDSDTVVKPFEENEKESSDDDSSDDDNKLNGKDEVKLTRLEDTNAAKKKEKKKNVTRRTDSQKRKRPPSSESDIDKDLKRLSNLKSLKKKHKSSRPSDSEITDEMEQSDGSKEKENIDSNSNKDGKKEKKSPEKKLVKNALLFTDSDEDNANDIQADDISTDDEVSFKKDSKKEDVKLDKSLNDIAKAMLKDELKSSGSEHVSESDDDDLKGKKKKLTKKGKKDDDKNQESSSSSSEEKKTKEENSSDSSIEEIKAVKKKKKKQDPLLKYKLSDSDSDDNSGSVASSSKKSKKNDNKKGKKKGQKKAVSDSDEDAVITEESGSDSDGSLSSLDDAFKKRKTRGAKKEEEKKKAAGKKRRRIKEVKDSSDGGEGNDSEDDEQNEDGSPSKGGRKKIRKIIKDSKLKDETKAAAREEEERRQRVAERQKMYNEAVVDKSKAGGPVTTKLVLDKNLETEEVLVEVHRKIIPNLKPHQVEGVKFLWDSVCESIEHMKTHPGSGCILAHCMGLGKTLQLITFIHTLLSNKRTKLHTALVVCPLNTVLNWANEFDIWLKGDKLKLDVYELSSVKNNWGRADLLSGWHESGGVCIMGYDMFRNLVQEKGKRINKRQREIFQRTLIDPGPDLVVCDEGHILKNDATALAKAMNRITTRRRVVLTGTPLQNNLSEYHCMVHFVKPNLLGTRKEFQNRFMNPIVNGQCADSTPHDFRLMKRRAHILHNLLDGCVQRRDYNVLTPFLPPKHEYVMSVRLSEIQIKLYRHFLDNFSRRLASSGKGSGLFADYQALMKIWTHPYVLKLSDVREENKVQYDSEDSFIDDDDENSTTSESSTDVKCLMNEPSSSRGRRTRGRAKDDDSNNSGDEVINNWTTRRQRGSDNEEIPEVKESSSSKEWWTEFVSEEDAQKVSLGGKLVLLLDILSECEAIGDKVLVFSQSLLSLDLIEIFLKRLDEKPEEPALPDKPAGPDSFNSWERGLDYFRMDGSTGADMRQRWTELFNSDDNTRARLFLISTRAGGLGINLVSANRVIIFDASWNPTHDVQSIFRVYRFGQKKPVYVYRFLAQGTMEEKIYDRQINKLSLACRVVDEQQIERHFNSSDLQELYNFDPDAKSKTATPMVPKDLLLAELLIRQKEWISGYHEHDSLLENKESEELTEEERKAAWAEYEAEKKGLISATAGLGVLSPTGSLDINTIIEKIQEQWPGLTQDELNEKVSHVIMWLRHQQQQQQMQAIQQQRQQQLLQQQQQQQAFLQQQQQALRQQQHYAMINEQYRQLAAQQMRFPAVNVNPASINPYLLENRGLTVSPVTTAPAAASSPSQPETRAATAKGSSDGKKTKSKK